MSGISDTPYIRMYDDGKEVSEILEIMNEDIAKEKARKEAEEAQRKVEEQNGKSWSISNLRKISMDKMNSHKCKKKNYLREF